MPQFSPFTGQVAVGETAVQLASSQPLTLGVEIIGLPANSGNLYYGFSSSVTTSTGMWIPPDGAYIPNLQASDCNQVWLISDTASQGASFTGI